MVERYKNGKIYKLVNDYNDKVYFGSTCLPLYKRLYKHRHQKLKSVTDMVEDIYDLKIILVENYPCETKEQLLMRERYYIDNFDCCNKMRPIITKKEDKKRDRLRYENNKEKILEQQKTYRENNKEKRNEKFECECGGKFTYTHKSIHLKTKRHQNYLLNKK